jgi:hypothetical protein
VASISAEESAGDAWALTGAAVQVSLWGFLRVSRQRCLRNAQPAKNEYVIKGRLQPRRSDWQIRKLDISIDYAIMLSVFASARLANLIQQMPPRRTPLRAPTGCGSVHVGKDGE